MQAAGGLRTTGCAGNRNRGKGHTAAALVALQVHCRGEHAVRPGRL